MFVLISYDITNDRKRYRVMKLLKNYGHRVQKSVFECELEEHHLLRLREQIRKEIVPEDDSVRYYILCRSCRDRVLLDGFGTPPEEESEFLII